MWNAQLPSGLWKQGRGVGSGRTSREKWERGTGAAGTPKALLALAASGVPRTDPRVIRAVDALTPHLPTWFEQRRDGLPDNATHCLSALAMALERWGRASEIREGEATHAFARGDAALLRKIGKWLAKRPRDGGWGSPGGWIDTMKYDARTRRWVNIDNDRTLGDRWIADGYTSTNTAQALLALRACSFARYRVPKKTLIEALNLIVRLKEKHGQPVSLYAAVVPADRVVSTGAAGNMVFSWGKQQPGRWKQTYVVSETKSKREWRLWMGTAWLGSAQMLTALAVIKELLTLSKSLTPELQVKCDGAILSTLASLQSSLRRLKDEGTPVDGDFGARYNGFRWQWWLMQALRLLGMNALGDTDLRAVTMAWIVSTQAKDGSWIRDHSQPKSPLIATENALLGLALRPVLRSGPLRPKPRLIVQDD